MLVVETAYLKITEMRKRSASQMEEACFQYNFKHGPKPTSTKSSGRCHPMLHPGEGTSPWPVYGIDVTETWLRRLDEARPSFWLHPLQKTEGAGNAGCWPHPWPACNKKRRRQSPQVSRNSPAFPARWFERLLRTLPGVPGLLAPVTGAFVTHQLDLSVGRSGPYDLAVRA